MTSGKTKYIHPMPWAMTFQSLELNLKKKKGSKTTNKSNEKANPSFQIMLSARLCIDSHNAKGTPVAGTAGISTETASRCQHPGVSMHKSSHGHFRCGCPAN
jgi:hypothetical protein